MHGDSSCKSQDIIPEKKGGGGGCVEMVGISLKHIDLISTFIIREKCKCTFGKLLELKPTVLNYKLSPDV